jgi:hypothetical protein
MKTPFTVFAATVLLVLAPTPCFALWEIAPVDKQVAKEMGIEVRSQPAGPKDVRVELDFKAEGKLKNFSHVDLRVGEGNEPLVSAALKEDRSKPGRVVVSFVADRNQLDKFTLWVFVPESLGGTIYEVRVKEFVDVAKGR